MKQLISYIALSAPATRRPGRGDEPFLRPEIGFTPKWYHHSTGVDFGERWHTNPEYRRDSIPKMAQEIKRRFGSVPIGPLQNSDTPNDILTGTFGASFVAAIYGIPIDYQFDKWPWSTHDHLDAEQIPQLEPPDLQLNDFFQNFLGQVDWIGRKMGRIEGYINWQGVLNNAYRIRGEDLFVDMILEPERAKHLFECVAQTMVDGARELYRHQRQSGVKVEHFTVSNCLVNMLSPDQYREFIFPWDMKISESFGLLGVHNCAWNATPYVDHYSSLPHVAYVDMGIESDMSRAREAFPEARRAIVYTPMAVAEKTEHEIREDLTQIAEDYGPCDLVLADIEMGVSDERVLALVRICEQLSQRHS